MKGMGIVATICLAVMPCVAEAGAQWYGSVKGGLLSIADMKAGGGSVSVSGINVGVSDLKAETDAGFILSAAVGRRTGAFRMEAEAFYGRADYALQGTVAAFGVTVSGISVEETATFTGVMLNGWFDLVQESELNPYLGGGLGSIWIDDGNESDDEGPAWQIGAGVAWKMSENIALDIGYRYLRSAFKPDFGGGIKFDALQSHSFNAGLRFNF